MPDGSRVCGRDEQGGPTQPAFALHILLADVAPVAGKAALDMAMARLRLAGGALRRLVDGFDRSATGLRSATTSSPAHHAASSATWIAARRQRWRANVV